MRIARLCQFACDIISSGGTPLSFMLRRQYNVVTGRSSSICADLRRLYVSPVPGRAHFLTPSPQPRRIVQALSESDTRTHAPNDVTSAMSADDSSTIKRPRDDNGECDAEYRDVPSAVKVPSPLGRTLTPFFMHFPPFWGGTNSSSLPRLDSKISTTPTRSSATPYFMRGTDGALTPTLFLARSLILSLQILGFIQESAAKKTLVILCVVRSSWLLRTVTPRAPWPPSTRH